MRVAEGNTKISFYVKIKSVWKMDWRNLNLQDVGRENHSDSIKFCESGAVEEDKKGFNLISPS